MDDHKKNLSDTQKAPNVASYEDARRLNIQKKKRYVLIVDDESTGRTILEQIIQKISDSLHIVGMDNPIKALTWLESHHPDLIVTDYRMPEMNGIEFIQQVRKRSDCENVPIMMITVSSEKSVRYDALDAGATAFLTRPIDRIECRTSCRNLLTMHEQQSIIQDRVEWLARQVELATRQIISRERETLLRLAKAGEYRDADTSYHVIRMSKYAREIAEEMGLNKSECETIEYAAPMHDIGKIGIPDGILLKAGKLDKDEWEIMKTHTVIGHAILSGSASQFIQSGAVIALNHHERFDGTGYPNGLKSHNIPLAARIVTVADVFDALVSVRPYKNAWPTEDALSYIKEQSGLQFDPQCVKAFFARLGKILKIQTDLRDKL